MPQIHLHVSPRQADVVVEALRLYAAIQANDYSAIAYYACPGPSSPSLGNSETLLFAMRESLAEMRLFMGYTEAPDQQIEPDTAALIDVVNDATRSDPSVVQIDLSIDHAKTLDSALNLLTRIGLGQYTAIADFVTIAPNDPAPKTVAEKIRRNLALLTQLEKLRADMGYARGQSWGVGAKQPLENCMRAYEIHKVIAQQINLQRDPKMLYHGVDSDGLIVRYTSDPAPIAELTQK